jgi:hypothetical protein
MRRLLALFLLIPAIGSIPARASASVLPPSGTLSWGYTRDLDGSFTGIPSASGAWAAGSHFAIRSSAAFFQTQSVQHSFSGVTPVGPPVETVSVRHSDFLPLTVGLRFYAAAPREHTRGFFLDASPAVLLARVPDRTGDHVFRAPLGVEFGAGVRVPAFDGSRLEVGLSYLHSSASGSGSLVSPLRSEPGSVFTPDLNLWTLRLGVGWGD